MCIIFILDSRKNKTWPCFDNGHDVFCLQRCIFLDTYKIGYPTGIRIRKILFSSDHIVGKPKRYCKLCDFLLVFCQGEDNIFGCSYSNRIKLPVHNLISINDISNQCVEDVSYVYVNAQNVFYKIKTSQHTCLHHVNN